SPFPTLRTRSAPPGGPPRASFPRGCCLRCAFGGGIPSPRRGRVPGAPCQTAPSREAGRLVSISSELLPGRKEPRDGGRRPLPLTRLLVELLFTGAGQRVILR